jgi:hypothetical protein
MLGGIERSDKARIDQEQAVLQDELTRGRTDATLGTTAEERRTQAGEDRDEFNLNKNEKKAREAIDSIILRNADDFMANPDKYLPEFESAIATFGIDEGGAERIMGSMKSVHQLFKDARDHRRELELGQHKGDYALRTARVKANTATSTAKYDAKMKSYEDRVKNNQKVIDANNKFLTSIDGQLMQEKDPERYSGIQARNAELEQRNQYWHNQRETLDPFNPDVPGAPRSIGGQSAEATEAKTATVAAPGGSVTATEDDTRGGAIDRILESRAKPQAKKAPVVEKKTAASEQPKRSKEAVSSTTKKKGTDFISGVKLGDAVKKKAKDTTAAVKGAVTGAAKNFISNWKASSSKLKKDKAEQKKVVVSLIGSDMIKAHYTTRGTMIKKIASETDIPLHRVTVIVNEELKKRKADKDDIFKGVGR